MKDSSLEKLLRLYDFVGIEKGKFVFQENEGSKSLIVKKDLRRFLYLASGILFLSAFLDIVLWLTTQYMVPCWTVALMSIATGAISLSLAYARFLFVEK